MDLLYKEKEKKYFKQARFDIINLIPYRDNKLKILEIGCGAGITLLELKKLKIAKYIAGVDLMNLNQERYLDKFICCDIEKEVEGLPFSQYFFDVIICADVLEHLIDPWTLLKNLKKYLKPEGYLIASIPNIREFKTMIKIFIKGDFKYENFGILDKTLLRFFCKKNMIQLFQQANFKIEKVIPKISSKKRKAMHKLSFKILEEFLALQYLILAKNKHV